MFHLEATSPLPTLCRFLVVTLLSFLRAVQMRQRPWRAPSYSWHGSINGFDGQRWHPPRRWVASGGEEDSNWWSLWNKQAGNHKGRLVGKTPVCCFSEYSMDSSHGRYEPCFQLQLLLSYETRLSMTRQRHMLTQHLTQVYKVCISPFFAAAHSHWDHPELRQVI